MNQGRGSFFQAIRLSSSEIEYDGREIPPDRCMRAIISVDVNPDGKYTKGVGI
ncbi:MAG: hypothetical protein P8182_08545 [Deltaproteobacteria bacterium]